MIGALIEKIVRWTNKFKEQKEEENTFTMTENKVEEAFDSLYDEWVEEEKVLEDIITRYATGEPNTTLTDFDDSVKRLKEIMKKSRKLAMEKRNEASDL